MACVMPETLPWHETQAEPDRLSTAVANGVADVVERRTAAPRHPSTSPLSLNGSPPHAPAHQQILEGSPPHDMLQAPPCCRNSPRAEPPAFLEPLARVIQRCVDSNAAVLASQGTTPAEQQQTAFHGLRVPPISIAAYLERIARYAKCSPVCFVMAETYLAKIAQVDPALRPCPLNIHRLLITGVLLAAKLMDDNYYNNAYYARIGGVSLEQLNGLELRMMQMLDYQLRVSAASVTHALAQFTAAADAPHWQFAACFGRLLIHTASPQQVAMTARAASAAFQQDATVVAALPAAVEVAVVQPPAPASDILLPMQQQHTMAGGDFGECRADHYAVVASTVAVSIPAF